MPLGMDMKERRREVLKDLFDLLSTYPSNNKGKMALEIEATL